jgi:hypothetical protein
MTLDDKRWMNSSSSLLHEKVKGIEKMRTRSVKWKQKLGLFWTFNRRRERRMESGQWATDRIQKTESEETRRKHNN